MEVRTSRVKAGVVAVVCAALTVLLAVAAQSTGWAWVGVGLAGLGLIAAGQRVVRPTTMFRLDDRELIVIGGIRGRPSVRWTQVRSVEVHRRGLLGSVVTLSIQDGRQSRRMEFSDTWLDKTAETIAQEVVDRANVRRVTDE